MKKLFEVYLTSEYVENEEWLKLFYKISKINGLFRPWNLWITIEKNYIRYFIETDRILPTILGELGSFLFKKSEIKLKEKFSISKPYILMQNNKTVIDVYDNNESKRMQKLKKIKIRFYPYKYNNYMSTTHIYLEKEDNKLIRRKVFLNSKIYEFVSINFGIHTRFYYQKNTARYLETKKTLNVLSSDKERAFLKVDAFPYLQEELYLKHTDYDFDKHSIVIGASGTGKSKMMSSIIKNLSSDNNNKFKYKVVVIDPHCAMEDDIGGLEDTKVVDFKTEEDSINLFMNGTDDILSSTESIIDIFKNIIADRYNSRLERVLRFSIHLLLEKKDFNLTNLRRLLTEIEYRNKILKELEHDIPINIVEFFKVDFNEIKTKAYQEAIAPIIAFIDEMQLLPAFNYENNIKNIKEEIEENFITILSLDQMTLGLNITKTIAGFAMQSILQLVQSHTFSEHIILLIDEVSVIETPIINRFLSEARKYNLSLILAGQYFEQISEGLRKAIFTNVVNYFIFRVSRIDAILLQDNIKMEVAVKNSHNNRMKILTELEDRECVVRIVKGGRLYSAVKGKTVDFTSVPRIKHSRNNEKTHKKIEVKEKNFNIESKNTLKDIMAKQSASRKKINL
mgnify:CR=1 FL=1